MINSAAIGRSEGGPAVLRETVGSWTQAVVPHQTAKLSTAATNAPVDCGPKPEPGQQLPQPCPRRLRPTALAEVLMKLTKSYIIEQHIDRLPKSVEPTNLGLGTPDAAALTVRIVRGWTNDMAGAPKQAQDADVVLPIDLENAHGRAFRSTCLEAARGTCPQLAAICAAQWEPCDTRFWQRCEVAGLLTAQRGVAGMVPEVCKLCCAWVGVCPLQVRCNSSAGGSRGLAFRTT